MLDSKIEKKSKSGMEKCLFICLFGRIDELVVF